MKKICYEGPEGQTLVAYLTALENAISDLDESYPLTEIGDRNYLAEVPGLLGNYRVVIEVVTDDITTSIDSGYVTIGSDDETYQVVNKKPTTTPPSTTPTPGRYSAYGPKRVKTKEMDIEQFDPHRIQIAEERSTLQEPSWCNGYSCIGVNKCE